MTAIVYSLPGNDWIAKRVGAYLALDVSSVSVHRSGTWWAARAD